MAYDDSGIPSKTQTPPSEEEIKAKYDFLKEEQEKGLVNLIEAVGPDREKFIPLIKVAERI